MKRLLRYCKNSLFFILQTILNYWIGLVVFDLLITSKFRKFAALNYHF